MLLANIPTKIPVPFGANALSPYIRQIPATSQIAIQNGAASFPDGFPSNCFQPNGFPFGQDFNGLFNQITQWIQWNNAGGPIQYDATFASAVNGYPAGTVLEATGAGTQGNFWYNTVDNNTTNPDQGGAGWIGFSIAIPTSLIHYGSDTGAQNALVANVLPAIQSLQTGMIFEIDAANANTIQNPTINIQGLGAKPIKRWDGSLLQPGDILQQPSPTLLAYNSSLSGVMYLLNPGNLLKVPPVLTAPLNLYVNNSTGSDSNNGLASTVGGGNGPFATLQKAENVAASYNLSVFNITVNVATGTGTYPGFTCLPVNGSGSINYLGNPGSPTSITIAGNTTSAIFAPSTTGNHSFNGFTLQSSGNPPGGSNDLCGGLVAISGGNFTLNNINFGVCSGGHMYIDAAVLALLGTLTVSGGCPGNTSIPVNTAHMAAVAGGVISVNAAAKPSMTISAPVTIGIWAEASQSGSMSVIYSSIAGASSVTAQKFNVFLNGTISVSGAGDAYYPGAGTGSRTTGGQYA